MAYRDTLNNIMKAFGLMTGQYRPAQPIVKAIQNTPWKDVGTGLAVRGPQALGKSIIAIPKGVAMATADLASTPPDPLNAPDIGDQEAKFQAQADAKDEAMKHVAKAIDTGTSKITADADGRPTLSLDPATEMKVAQIYSSRLQAPAKTPSTATRLGAVFDTLTGGHPLSADYTKVYATGQPEIDPAVSGDTTGLVRPQTSLGAAADQAVPLAWNVLAGKAFLQPGVASSGLSGLGKMGAFFGGKQYPESYAAARSNPEVTPQAAHNYATTMAVSQAVLPMLGVTRLGSGALGRGVSALTRLEPEAGQALAQGGLTAADAAAQTALEGRARTYLDPTASEFSGQDFLHNLALMGGMSALHGGYESLKRGTAAQVPPTGLTDPGDLSTGRTPQTLERAFQTLQGRTLSEKLGAENWVNTIRSKFPGTDFNQLLDYMDAKRAQGQGSKLPLPEGVDPAAMEKILQDPDFSGFHKRLWQMYSDTQGMKGNSANDYDPYYVPRALMQSPHAEMPNGPMTGGGIAKTMSGQLKPRTYMAVEDAAGDRTVVSHEGRTALSYDPETREPSSMYRKSTLGMEARPVINKMVSTMADLVGRRDQNASAELTRVGADVDKAGVLVEKHMNTLDDLEIQLQDLQQQRGEIAAQLQDLQTSKPAEAFTSDEKTIGNQLLQARNQLDLKIEKTKSDYQDTGIKLDDAQQLHSAALTGLESHVSRVLADRNLDPKELLANDPKAAKALDAWNQAAGNMSQMQRNFGSGNEAHWSRSPVWRKVGAGRDWSENLHKMTDATTAEIHGQMPQNRYRTDPLLNMAEGSVDTFGAHGGTQVLNELQNNQKFSRKIGQDEVPEGWVQPSMNVLSRAPGLRGYALEPKVNQLLETMAHGAKPEGFLKSMGDLYMDLGFANPSVHWHNMVAHFVKTAGASTLTPEGADRMAGNLERARMAVLKPNDDTRSFLAGGGTLMTRRDVARSWDKLFEGQEDIATRNRKGVETPTGLAVDDQQSRVNRPDMADVEGSVVDAVKQHGLLKGLVQMPIASMNKNMTWKVDDQMRMALVLDHMQKNKMPETPANWKKAIDAVNETYPDYKNSLFRFQGNNKVSMGANALMQKAANSDALNFMRYRFGAWQSLLNSVAHPVEHADKLGALGLTMAAGAGVATPIIRTLSGDDQTEYRGGGPTHIIKQLEKLGTTYDASNFLQGQGILRPELQLLANIMSRGTTKGNFSDLYNFPGADPEDKAALLKNMGKMTVRAGAAPLMWGQDLMNATEGHGDLGRSAALQLLGGSPDKTMAEARMGLQQKNLLPADDTSIEGDNRRDAKLDAKALLNKGDFKGLQKMIVEGRLTPEDYGTMLAGAAKTREEKLADRISKLTLDKATAVISSANPQEFEAALPVMLQKAQDAAEGGKLLPNVVEFYKELQKRVSRHELSSDWGFQPQDVQDMLNAIRTMRKDRTSGTDEAEADIEKE